MSEDKEIKKEKIVGDAFVLWFISGLFGGHRFYLNKIGSAIAMAVITVVSIASWSEGIGVIGFIVVIFWWLIDAFLIAGMVRKYNEDEEIVSLVKNHDQDEDVASSNEAAETNEEPIKKSEEDNLEEEGEEEEEEIVITISRDTIAMMEFEAGKKNELAAYFLWFFAGIVGAHQFYINKVGSGIFLVVIFLFSGGSIAYGMVNFSETGLAVGGIGLLFGLLFWLGSAFDIAGVVKQHNLELIEKVKYETIPKQKKKKGKKKGKKND